MKLNPNDASVVFSKISILISSHKTASVRLYQHIHSKNLSFTSSSNSLNLFEGSQDTKSNISSLIRQCIDGKSIIGIKNLHAQMIKSGFLVQFSGSKLIDACLKCGQIVYARHLFDEMPDRHIVTWNSMIASCITHKRSREAVELYHSMVSAGILPDEYTFSSIFKAFSELGLERDGRRSHGLCIILGLGISNPFVGSALIDMYAKLGKMRDARLVLDRVVDKDVVLFTAMIVGYSQCGQDNESMEVFKAMINEGIRANEYTYASVLIACGNSGDLGYGKLIHGLMLKSGLDSAVASLTSLLTMYSKCGLIVDSLRVFKLIDNPNQVTWTSLISGLVQNGREETALTKFRKMMSDSVKPNSFTFSSLLRGCSSLSMFEEGRQIHGVVTKMGLDRHRFIGAGLVELYGKCGCIAMARSVFDSLDDIDLISLNSMMYNYAQNGFGKEALELFNKMEDLGLKANEMTVLSILLACNNSGLVDEGCKFFASVKSTSSVPLTKDHYACMVDLLGRAGRLSEAEMLIKEVENRDVVLWRTLLSACKIHRDVEMAEKVKCKLLELAPGDEGTLVLMSNIYASTGKWNKVIETKSEMRGMALKKIRAMSWVELDKRVHTFMAGDFSHPNSAEIVETLEELIEKAQKLGYVADTSCVLQDMDKESKVRSLYYHSEKLAIAFAVWKSGNRNTSIRVLKNLRVCGDCHNWIKIVSCVIGREIVCRDAKRFHHFRNGLCSCGDYW